MSLAAPQGGYSVIRYAIILLHTQIRYFKVLFRHFVVLYVYFIILDIKRAENAKKRPFVIRAIV